MGVGLAQHIMVVYVHVQDLKQHLHQEYTNTKSVIIQILSSA